MGKSQTTSFICFWVHLPGASLIASGLDLPTPQCTTDCHSTGPPARRQSTPQAPRPGNGALHRPPGPPTERCTGPLARRRSSRGLPCLAIAVLDTSWSAGSWLGSCYSRCLASLVPCAVLNLRHGNPLLGKCLYLWGEQKSEKVTFLGTRIKVLFIFIYISVFSTLNITFIIR